MHTNHRRNFYGRQVHRWRLWQMLKEDARVNRRVSEKHYLAKIKNGADPEDITFPYKKQEFSDRWDVT